MKRPKKPKDVARQPAPPASEIEQLLCAPAAQGALDALLPRIADAWALQLPSLASFAARREGKVKPRICIATEQITGPVRNGGIGTTYAALADLLAEAGFDITVLYLRGTVVETESIDHWIAWYAAKGVSLVPVPDYAAAENFQSAANRWLRGQYNMMRWLIDHPMDVVHASEWRGSAWLSLLAKRQGLAFGDTLFAVKTSSPWLWNRMYGAHAVEKPEDLTKIQAERGSVELADVVIGGSLHLLRWMASQGYAIPRARAFVQPNVVSFAALQPLMKARALPGGQRTPIEEFVFFGRLESRKGLFVFCQAIRRLIRQGVALPANITFMGKPGGRMASHPDQDTPDYIRAVTADWPTKVQILDQFQQFEAIDYLLGGPRLAVMPSIIENSSMAIYEAAICGIPAVATDVGGNSELIQPADHAAVLCQPHPVALGDKLAEALALGGMVPRPSFDNDANLETWRRWHRQLGGKLREDLLRQAQPALVAAKSPTAGTAVCIYHPGDAAALETTLASLAAQTRPPREVLVGIDAESNAAAGEATRLLARHGLAGEAVDAFDLDAGAAFNAMAARATSDHLLFLWEGATLMPEALARLEAVAATGIAVLTWLHRVGQRAAAKDKPAELRAVVIGSASTSYFREDSRELPLMVSREAFLRLDGFTGDYRAVGYDHEFVAKAQLAALRCETAMAELGAILPRSADQLRQRGYDLAASGFRPIRPALAATPLALRDLLLLTRGLQLRLGPGGKGKSAGKSGEPPPTPEDVLVRMLAGLRQDEAAAAAKPAKPRASAAKPRNPAAANAINLALSGKPARTPPKPVAKPSAKAAPKPDAKPAAPPPAASGALSQTLQRLIDERFVRSDGTLIGQLLGVHEGRLYGWARVIGNARRRLEVELTVGGRTTLHRADLQFAAHADLPGEVGAHGFAVDLAGGFEQRRKPASYAVKIADSALLLGSGEVMPASATLERCGIDADWQPNAEGLIAGWAWYPRLPERRVDITAFADSAFLARFRADLPRGDAGEAGGPAGNYRFRFTLPEALRAAGRHRLELNVADSGVPLHAAPGWAEGLEIDIERPRKWQLFGR